MEPSRHITHHNDHLGKPVIYKHNYTVIKIILEEDICLN